MKGILLFAPVLLFACRQASKPGQPDRDPVTLPVTQTVRAPASVSDTLAEGSLTPAERDRMERFTRYESSGSQRYAVAAETSTIVTGTGGTQLHIVPADLELPDGGPVIGPIDVELMELFTTRDMMQAKVTTCSDGRLLVSGGSYYIGLSSCGKSLRLKSGRTMNVRFPCHTYEDMQLFYGESTAKGINWKPTETDFEPVYARRWLGCGGYDHDSIAYYAKMDRVLDTFNKTTWDRNRSGPMVVVSSMEEAERYLLSAGGLDTTLPPRDSSGLVKKARRESYYRDIGISRLGWINCDRFLDRPNKMDLIVKAGPNVDLGKTHIYLLFRDINSLMDATAQSSARKLLKFEGVPVGYRARLIAFSAEGDKILGFASDLVLDRGTTVTVKLKPMNREGLKQLTTN